MNNSTKEHQEAVNRILRYLKMTPGRGLFLRESTKTEIFIDGNWANSLLDRRSTLDYYTYVWGNLVTWKSNKQQVVGSSRAKAKFQFMTHGICVCDNKAAINIVKNPVDHDRTKYVEID